MPRVKLPEMVTGTIIKCSDMTNDGRLRSPEGFLCRWSFYWRGSRIGEPGELRDALVMRSLFHNATVTLFRFDTPWWELPDRNGRFALKINL